MLPPKMVAFFLSNVQNLFRIFSVNAIEPCKCLRVIQVDIVAVNYSMFIIFLFQESKYKLVIKKRASGYLSILDLQINFAIDMPQRITIQACHYLSMSRSLWGACPLPSQS